MWARIRDRLFGRGPKGTPGSPPHPSSLPPAAAGADQYFTDGIGFRIREKVLEQTLLDLETALLESDVALEVAERMVKDVRKALRDRRLKLGEDPAEAIEASLRATALHLLDQPPLDVVARIREGPRPFVVLFLGVNGSGKTTTIAKLAHRLRQEGFSVVLAASDTFRAGAIEQISLHGDRLGVKVVRQTEGADPAAVAFDALQHARSRHLDVVLVDTAGRQHTNVNLVEEAKKIRRVVQPHLTLFVGDALSGNDMVEQARIFNEQLGFDAAILTKLDCDTKGGSALSIVSAVKRPIALVGMGQGYDDLRPFDASWMVTRLFPQGVEASS
jgi:fused signal recognition particle receptor